MKLGHLGQCNKGFYSPEKKILPIRYQKNSWYICEIKSIILNQDIIVFPSPVLALGAIFEFKIFWNTWLLTFSPFQQKKSRFLSPTPTAARSIIEAGLFVFLVYRAPVSLSISGIDRYCREYLDLSTFDCSLVKLILFFGQQDFSKFKSLLQKVRRYFCAKFCQ